MINNHKIISVVIYIIFLSGNFTQTHAEIVNKYNPFIKKKVVVHVIDPEQVGNFDGVKNCGKDIKTFRADGCTYSRNNKPYRIEISNDKNFTNLMMNFCDENDVVNMFEFFLLHEVGHYLNPRSDEKYADNYACSLIQYRATLL